MTLAANSSMDVPLRIHVRRDDRAGNVSIHGDGSRFHREWRPGCSAGQRYRGRCAGLATPARRMRDLVQLTPASATAGQGTSAQYVVRLTNTGSTDDTFSLATLGLPSGITASFGQTTIDVPPGVSNFRDVSLTLTAGPRDHARQLSVHRDRHVHQRSDRDQHDQRHGNRRPERRSGDAIAA